MEVLYNISSNLPYIRRWGSGIINLCGKIKKCNFIKNLLKAGLIVLFANQVYGASFYVSPDGSDAAGIGSSSSPWKTATKAFVQGGGQTYIFKDGVYDYAGGNITNPPNGSVSSYTVILAEHDGGAVLKNFTQAITIDRKSFVQIEGLTIKDGTGSHAVYITDSNHIKILRVGVKNGIAWSAQYGNVIELSSNDNATGTKDCLLEDIWVVGAMRYGILIGGTAGFSERNILRRCVVRFDGGGSPEPHAGISNYGATSGIDGARNNILQNCVTIDFNPPNNPTGEGLYAGFYNPHAATNIDFYGCIALKTRDRGWLLNEDSGSTGNDMSNCVVWGAATDGIAGQHSQSTGSIIEQVTVGASGGNGFWNYSNMVSTIRNSLFTSNGAGNINASSETFNHYWQNSPEGEHPLTSDPLIKFITQIEPDSPAYLSGLNGLSRGATVVKRYGVSGTLYGETGYDGLTSEDLWPWPNQERIQNLFAEPDAGNSIPLNNPARGFAAPGTSLTQYIWNTLGNPNPYPSAPDNDPPIVSISSPSAGAAVSGDVTIKASVFDNIIVKKVELMVDGVLNQTDYSVPYNFIWDTFYESNSSHTVQVAGYDYSNNTAIASVTLTVLNLPDGIAPNVFIGAPIGGSTVRGAVSVNANATDDQKVRQVLFFIDAEFKSTDTTNPFTYSWDTLSVAEGTHTVSAQAIDVGGNSSSGSITVTVENIDIASPTVLITTPVAGSIIRGSITVIANASDNFGVTRVIFSVDGVVHSTDMASPYKFTWNTLTVSEGAHTLTAQAFDVAGFSSTGTAIVTVENIDIIAPAVSITDPADGSTVKGSTTVKAIASDNFAVTLVQFLIDGVARSTSAAIPYSFSWDAINETTGAHVVTARAFDAAGFISTSAITVSVLDITPPAVLISTPANGSVLVGTITLAVNPTDYIGVALVQFLVDGIEASSQEAGPYNFTWNASTFVIGAHVLSARAYDASGNHATSSITITVPDTVLPECSFVTPANGSSVSGNVIVGAAASDNVRVDRIQFSVDGATRSVVFSSPYSFVWDSRIESTGSHVLGAIAFDDAGNNASSSVTVSVQDVTPPAVSISTPANGSVLVGTVALAVSATDFIGVKLVQFLVDGVLFSSSAVSPYNFTWNASTSVIGTHMLKAQAFDAAGNNANSSITVTVPDTVPPAVTLSSPVQGDAVSSAVNIAAIASDNIGVTKVQFSIDGIVIATDTSNPYSFAWNTTIEQVGSHKVAALAFDAAGNNSMSSATVTVLDVTPPTVSISTPANGSVVIGTVSILAEATDFIGVDVVELLIDGIFVSSAAVNPYGFVWDAPAVAVGTHTMLVRAYDAAGNFATSTLSVAIPDTTPPVVLISSPADGAGVSGSVTLTADASDNIGVTKVQFSVDGVVRSTDSDAPFAYAWNTIGEPIGSHLLTALAFDARDNSVSSSVTVIVLDVTAPTVLLTAPADGAGISGFVTVTATASDNVGLERVQFLIDGIAQSTVTVSPYGYVWDSSSATIGAHTISARAYDAAGNNATSSIAIIVQDINLPVISLTAPIAGAEVSGIVNVTANAADNVAVTRVQFLVDGTVRSTDSTNPYSYAWNSAGESIGLHVLSARAFDAQENTSASSVTVTVLDVEDPIVTLTAPSGDAGVSGVIGVAASASDNIGVARVQFFVDAIIRSTDSAAPYNFSWDTAGESIGTHSLTARAFDARGNTSIHSVSVTVLDISAPTISITIPVNGSTVTGSISISATATDDAGVVQVQFWTDGSVGPIIFSPPYSFVWNSSTASVGPHTIQARAYDAAGNSADAFSTVIVPDISSPTVSISAPAQGATVSGAVSIAASASDNIGISRLQFLVDGVVASTDATPPYSFTWDTLSESSGAHAIGAIAFDAAGNSSASFITISLSNPDIAAPSVLLTNPASDATVLGTVVIAASASDNFGIARVQFLLDGIVLSTDASFPYDYSWDTLTSVNGAHQLSARAYDAAGNNAARSFTVTVANPDISSPTVSLTAPIPGATVYGLTDISASASDNIGVIKVQFSIDGAVRSTDSAIPFSHAWDAAAESTGPHTITARAFDAAGNSATNSIFITVTSPSVIVPVIDASSPAVSITAPADGSKVYGIVNISANASDDTGVVRVEFLVNGGIIASISSGPYAYSWNSETFNFGTYTVTARAFDAAGNRASADITVYRFATKLLAVIGQGGGSASGVSSLSHATSTVRLSIVSNDPIFSGNSLAVILHLPSGNKSLDFARLTGGSASYFAEAEGNVVGLAELQSISNHELFLTVSNQGLLAKIVTGVIMPGVGGTISENAPPSAQVIFNADSITQEAQIIFSAEPSESRAARDLALANQNLISLGMGREITFISSGSLTSALLVLPYDPFLIPAGYSAGAVKIAYYNPATGAWELLNANISAGNTVQATVTHFSIYKPVLQAVSPATIVSNESYVFPNPAVGSDDPTIRVAFPGSIEIELKIYDVAGLQVHQALIPANPFGQTDYTWTGPKASGMYVAYVEGKASGGSAGKTLMNFAVVR